MEKRTLLAVVLSSAILIIYYGFLYKPPEAPVQAPVATALPSTPTPTAPGVLPPGKTPTPGPVPTSKPEAESVPRAPVVLTPFQTQLVRTELSSKSGLSLNWWLKKFFEQSDNKGPNINLLIGDDQNLPLGILMFPNQGPVFPYFQSDDSQSSPEFSYQGQVANLEVEQKLVFGQKDYSFDVTLVVTNRGSTSQALAPGIRLTTRQYKEEKKKGGFLNFGQTSNLIHPLYREGTSIEREQKVKELGTYTEKVGDITWTGLEDRYFLRAVISRSVSPQNQTAFGVMGNWIFSDFRYGLDNLAPGTTKEYQFTLFLGPKDPTYLDQFSGVDLGKAIDHGWFGVVARPILYSMKFFYSFLGNWGLAIILLTVIIKVLLYPLTKKSMASMKAMQKLQPQLKKIREKYKDDRERLNMETMNLFKAHKVNPMGGCLPMIIQMPIYIALYKVLYNSTELYHAPFFWFYRDLSAPDPYFILPILLGVAMVAQQKMTPTTGDPTQAKMMMVMPVLFTVFMLFLPVGLVLYIFVNTIMTVIQQYMHQHDITVLGLLKKKKGLLKKKKAGSP